MCASNSHSYTHLILALGIVREPTVWVFISSKYPGIHGIGRANNSVLVYGYEGCFILNGIHTEHTKRNTVARQYGRQPSWRRRPALVERLPQTKQSQRALRK